MNSFLQQPIQYFRHRCIAYPFPQIQHFQKSCIPLQALPTHSHEWFPGEEEIKTLNQGIVPYHHILPYIARVSSCRMLRRMLCRMLCSTGQTFPKDSSSAKSFLHTLEAIREEEKGGKKKEKSASLTSQVCFHAQWIATCILWAQFSAQWAKVGINSWLQQLKDWPLMLTKCCRLSGLLPSPGHTFHHQANQQSEHLGEFSL